MTITVSKGRGPELFGAHETAAHLNVLVSNLNKMSGLPAPIAELNCGRIWLAAEVKAYGKARARRAKERIKGA